MVSVLLDYHYTCVIFSCPPPQWYLIGFLFKDQFRDIIKDYFWFIEIPQGKFSQILLIFLRHGWLKCVQSKLNQSELFINYYGGPKYLNSRIWKLKCTIDQYSSRGFLSPAPAKALEQSMFFAKILFPMFFYSFG